MTAVGTTKRQLVRVAGMAGIGILVDALAPDSIIAAAFAQQKKEQKEEVTPPEDLMREHGLLDRLLLIYEAGMRRISANENFDPAVITQSAQIVRDFIHNYHEKSEEEQVFPRFKNAGKMVDLVNTLLAQHQAGRRVTESILQLAPASPRSPDDRKRLAAAMSSFIIMYRPHAAREDTDLFPQLQKLVSANEYDAMAEEFERKEHQLFGQDGFENMVQRVASLEQAVGIHDLSQFTPR